MVEECRKLKKAKEKSDSHDHRSSKVNHVQSKEAHPSQPSNFSLTAEQYQSLWALLGNNKTPTMANLVRASFNNLSNNSLCGIVLWKKRAQILDSTVTDYIICSPDLFTTCSTVHNQTINLPNGMAAAMTHIRNIQFSAKLILHNVLLCSLIQIKLNLCQQVGQVFRLCCHFC